MNQTFDNLIKKNNYYESKPTEPDEDNVTSEAASNLKKIKDKFNNYGGNISINDQREKSFQPDAHLQSFQDKRSFQLPLILEPDEQIKGINQQKRQNSDGMLKVHLIQPSAKNSYNTKTSSFFTRDRGNKTVMENMIQKFQSAKRMASALSSGVNHRMKSNATPTNQSRVVE